MKYFLIILPFLSLQSCVVWDSNTQADRLKITYADSDALLLEPLVDVYLQECEKRGVRFRNRKVRISTKDMEANGSGNSFTRQVKISTSSQAWRNYTHEFNPRHGDMLRVVSHEMSHSLLGFTHRNKKDSQQRFMYNSEVFATSIMNPTGWSMPETDGVFSELWEYYFDELFRKTDVIPGNTTIDTREPFGIIEDHFCKSEEN